MKATIYGKEYLVEPAAHKPTVNGRPFSGDILEYREGKYHILVRHTSYQAEIVELNRGEKTVTVRVNSNTYRVSVKDKYDELLHELGLDESNARKGGDVKAPMPGLVLNVLVEAGQKIKKGEAMVVLEAMKMENILKAVADGEVKKVLVQKGDKVEKNQVMVHFE